MQYIFAFILFAFVVSLNNVNGYLYPIAVRLPLNGTPPASGSALWPMPSKYTMTRQYFLLNRDKFQFKLGNVNSCEKEIIDVITSRYNNIIFPPKLSYGYPAPGEIELNELKIDITNSNGASNNCAKDYYPLINDVDDEKYEIRVTSTGAFLSANKVWGVIKGIETFSQLIYQLNNTYKLAINESTVEDKPRFLHRGIMLDSSRHYLPIALIKKHLDTAMYNKFNVFHWHLTDDQSFPFVSEVYPKLSSMGAYSSKHIYTKSDVKDLIEFARVRGIRIIPEFDTPGHTASWGLGYPELVTVCWNDNKPYQIVYNKHGAVEILNPMNEFTYEFMNNFLKEVKDSFVDPFVHLGMDEVYYHCWESNPDIQKWKEKNNFTQTKDIEQYYMGRVLTIAEKLNYKVTVWQDVFDNNVTVFDGTVIQIWKDYKEGSYPYTWQEYVNQVTKKGYKTILSSPWYLNYIKYGIDWPDYYKIEPLDFGGTAAQRNLVIGGETCMWGEFIDGSNSMARLWPRASAVAERLWSAANINDSEEAKYRLDEHRCRMLRRGIDAQPILNGFCGDYEAYFDKSVLDHPYFNYNSQDEHVQPNIAIMTNICVTLYLIVFFIYTVLLSF